MPTEPVIAVFHKNIKSFKRNNKLYYYSKL